MNRTRCTRITRRGALRSAAACLLLCLPPAGAATPSAAVAPAPSLYLPRSLRKLQPSALVVVLLPAGVGNNAAPRLRDSGWTALADSEGFAVVGVAEGSTSEATRTAIEQAMAAAKKAMRLDFGRVFLAAADGVTPPAAVASEFVAVAVEPEGGDAAVPSLRSGGRSPSVCLLRRGDTLPAAARETFRRTAAEAGFSAEAESARRGGNPPQESRVSTETGREAALVPLAGRTAAEASWAFFEEHAVGPARITATVTGLRGGDRGYVVAVLFAGGEGFPDDAEKALAQRDAPVENGRAILTFDEVPSPGAFAIVILHDENANGRMDTSFGLPSEGYGASNNPKTRFGPPKYEDARFTVRGRGAVKSVEIKAVYLVGGSGR